MRTTRRSGLLDATNAIRTRRIVVRYCTRKHYLAARTSRTNECYRLNLNVMSVPVFFLLAPRTCFERATAARRFRRFPCGSRDRSLFFSILYHADPVKCRFNIYIMVISFFSSSAACRVQGFINLILPYTRIHVYIYIYFFYLYRDTHVRTVTPERAATY